MRFLDLVPVVGFATTVSAGTISAPLTRARPFKAPHSVNRRADDIELKALNNITGGGYYSEFSIGTPPQKLSFLLDTGSSDTWVNSVDADLCNSDRLQQATGSYCLTTFKPDDSKTFEIVDQGGFNITYLDDRNIQGDYFNDTVTLDGQKIENQQLGLALKSVRGAGIMGLGFSTNVAADIQYPTIIDNMVSAGYINSGVFSLYLNQFSSDSGNILFGGVDTKRYVDKLTTLPLLKQLDSLGAATNATSYAVQLDDFSVKGVNVGSLQAPAILDSGSTVSLMPEPQALALWDKFDVQMLRDGDTGEVIPITFVDCAQAEKNKGLTFDFTFGDKTIKVPIDEMIIDIFGGLTGSQLSPSLASWDTVCTFGIGNSAMYGIDFALLGDTFLRSAYVVYDMANFQLGIAQANPDASDSNIVEIKAGATTLPSDSGVDASDANKGSSGNSGNSGNDNDNNDGDSGSGSDGNSNDGGSGSGSDGNSNDDDDEGAAGHLSPPSGLVTLAATLMVGTAAFMSAL